MHQWIHKKISLVDFSISFFVKRFGFVKVNKNIIHPKNAFTLLCLFLRKTRANMMGNMKRTKRKNISLWNQFWIRLIQGKHFSASRFPGGMMHSILRSSRVFREDVGLTSVSKYLLSTINNFDVVCNVIYIWSVYHITTRLGAYQNHISLSNIGWAY